MLPFGYPYSQRIPMTSLLTLACDEGVVIAGDSAWTDTMHGVKSHGDKIFRIPGMNIIAGGAGNAAVVTQVVKALADLQPFATVEGLAKNVSEIANPILLQHREGFVPWNAEIGRAS